MAHYGYPTVDSCHGHSCDGAELLVEFAHELCIFRVNMFSMSIFSNHHWSDTQLWPIREAQGTSNPGWFLKPQVFNWSGQGAQVVKTQIALWSSWSCSGQIHSIDAIDISWFGRCHQPPGSGRDPSKTCEKCVGSLENQGNFAGWVDCAASFRGFHGYFMDISWIFHGYLMDI